MKRREVLAGGGLALHAFSGCVGRTNGIRRSGGGLRRVVAVADTDTAPARYGLGFSVDVPTPTITPKRTATLRIAVENAGSEQTKVYTGRRAVFSGIENVDDGPKLALVGPGGAVKESAPTEEGSSCWTLEEHWIGQPLVYHTLDPGEHADVTLRMLDPESADNCFPPGTYRYVNKYWFDPNASETFKWGFVLRVETG